MTTTRPLLLYGQDVDTLPVIHGLALRLTRGLRRVNVKRDPRVVLDDVSDALTGDQDALDLLREQYGVAIPPADKRGQRPWCSVQDLLRARIEELETT